MRSFCRWVGPAVLALLWFGKSRAQVSPRQAADDLSGWIYDQIQWVRQDPARRCVRFARSVDEVWRRPRSEAEIQAWLDMLTNEGYVFLVSGDIVPSTDAYTAAYEWARQHPEIADDGLVLENILKPLGNNYTRLGDYEQALFIHKKALNLALTAGDKQALAGVYSNLANTCSNMGEPGAALDYCRLGLAAANGRSALYGLLLSEKADACLQLRQTDAAKTSIGESIALLELSSLQTVETGNWLLMAYQQAGDIYAAEAGRALAWYRRALALQDRLLREGKEVPRRERAKLFQRLGSLFLRLHDNARSAYWTDQCLGVLVPGRRAGSLQERDVYAENTLSDLLYTKAVLAERSGKTDEALRLYTLCFVSLRELREQFVTGSSKERAVADERQRFGDAIETAWNAWKQTGREKYAQSMLSFMESSKSQLLLEERMQQSQSFAGYRDDTMRMRLRLLEKALIYYQKEDIGKKTSQTDQGREAQVTWELAQLRKKIAATGRRAVEEEDPAASPVLAGADPVASYLQDKEAVRCFFAAPTALYTIECTRNGIRFADKTELSPSWQNEIREFTDTWFGGGPAAMIDHPQTYCRQAFRLYEQFFAGHPFAPETHYILLPDGAMDLLPVDALVTRADCPASPAAWPFVIRQASLSYAWSLQMLRRHDGHSVDDRGFAGFFVAENGGAMPYLQAVDEEWKGIVASIGNGRYFRDSSATTDNFRNAVSSSSVIHISSHAFAKTGATEAPCIELYNGPYYLFELKAVTHAPQLVVLSACRTGDGRLVAGEGAQSLGRAFIGAGAGAVVAGWWNVNDAAASRLMNGFYRQLTREPLDAHGRTDATAALRRAKLEWLNDPGVAYLDKLPYFWASLNYQGDPEPIGSGLRAGRHRGLPIARWWWSALLLPFIIWAYGRGRRAYRRR
ncbi:MAG TPA: CHAT domain-containing protein [Puia sp.]|nr:CHAT domain-containing protein [Puia sp.]